MAFWRAAIREAHRRSMRQVIGNYLSAERP
jgi:hypothetical protein